MSDPCVDNLVDKIITMGIKTKVICFVIIILSVIFSGVCYWYTGKIDNPGTEFAEEVIEEVVKKETGIDIEKLLPPSKHSRDD